MTWIQVLLDFLRQFLPLVVLRSYHQGVRFVLGHAKGPYGPGVYLTIPMLYEMVPVLVNERVVDLLNIGVKTKDGLAVTLSANINYIITDGLKATVNVGDVENSMAAEAMKHLHRLTRRADATKLFGGQRRVERSIQAAIQRKAEDWGVEILDVGLTDLVPTRFYRLYGAP